MFFETYHQLIQHERAINKRSGAKLKAKIKKLEAEVEYFKQLLIPKDISTEQPTTAPKMYECQHLPSATCSMDVPCSTCTIRIKGGI